MPRRAGCGAGFRFSRLAILSALLSGCWPTGLMATVVNVNILGSSFSPSTVAIHVNDQVQWTWQSDFHSTTSTTGLWDSGVFNSGHTYGHTFGASGNFPYICTVHGFAGSVTVQTVNARPVVTITSPANGAVLIAPASFTLQASATDSDGSVTSVQFFRGTTLLGTVRTNPYAVSVSGLGAGSYSFSAVATDNGGLTATNTIAVSVVATPTITTNPANTAVKVGGQATFGVAAAGGNLRYRWWWTHPDNTTTTSPAWTNATLTLTNVQAGSAGSYYAVVTNLAGTATSTAAQLTVSPVINSQPQNETVVTGTSAGFQVGATGLSLRYAWRFNGAALAGATNSSLVINSAQAANEGNYRVVVTNPAGSVTSVVATLTVALPPTITVPPRSQTVAAGGNVTLSVTASGTAPISYQWAFNGANLAGATKSSLSRTNFQAAYQGSYTVTLSNLAAVRMSDAASLYLNRPLRFATSDVDIDGHFSTRLIGVAGSNYAIQASTDLINWTTLQTTQATNGIIDISDTNSVSYPSRFFRAK